MKCPSCQAILGNLNSKGEPIVRNRGLVFKAEGVTMVCPKCKSDVPMTTDFAKALSDRLVLFIQKKPAQDLGLAKNRS